MPHSPLKLNPKRPFQSLHSYCEHLQKPGFWGGEPELLVLSKMLQVPVLVYLPAKDAGKKCVRACSVWCASRARGCVSSARCAAVEYGLAGRHSRAGARAMPVFACVLRRAPPAGPPCSCHTCPTPPNHAAPGATHRTPPKRRVERRSPSRNAKLPPQNPGTGAPRRAAPTRRSPSTGWSTPGSASRCGCCTRAATTMTCCWRERVVTHRAR